MPVLNRCFFFSLLLAALSVASFAQANETPAADPAVVPDETPVSADDELFGGNLFVTDDGTPEASDAVVADAAESTASQSTAVAVAPDLLAGTEGVRWNGNVGFRMNGTTVWTNRPLSELGAPTDSSLSAGVNMDLSMDARPDDSFRAHLSTSFSYPFPAGGSFGDALGIKEIFADWDFNNLVFMRAGKSTIAWGVGYFYSPADVLNLVPVDPADPEAEREGPMSLRVHIPFGLNSLWLYLIANGVEDWSDLGGAVKTDILVGTAELGIGAFYRYGVAPRLTLTATFPLWRLTCFAEAVGSYGSDRRIVVEETPGALSVVTDDEGFYFQGTAGFRFNLTDVLVDAPSLSLMAQYLFDGTGYADPSILRLPGVMALIAADQLSPSDLRAPGMHQVAARLSYADMFDSDFSSNVGWNADLSDGSGRFSAGLSLRLTDFSAATSFAWLYDPDGSSRIETGLSMDFLERISFGATFAILSGDPGNRLSPQGESASLTFTLSAGSGTF